MVEAPKPSDIPVRAGAKPRLTYRDLRRRSRDLVPERQSRRGIATTARDHGQAEAVRGFEGGMNSGVASGDRRGWATGFGSLSP
jgi:hypothetical protein